MVDAEAQTLGRLATQIADLLRGKGKPQYTPHIDTGDFVVVVNAEKVHVTGKKLEQKIYYRHSGYPGGLRERTLAEQLAAAPRGGAAQGGARACCPRTGWPPPSCASSRSTPGRSIRTRPRTPIPLEDRTLVADRPAVSPTAAPASARTRWPGSILVPGAGTVTVNGRTLEDYFPRQTLQSIALAPLRLTGTDSAASTCARGSTAAASPARPARFATASRGRCCEADGELRADLKKQGFLTRDAREVERKKAGLKKARKRPQFSKR